MRNILTILFITILSVTNLWSNQGLSHNINSQLLVIDRDITGDSIITWCQEVGGYFVQRTPDVIYLRIPNNSLTGLKPFLESISSEIINYQQESTNLNPSISMLKSGIKAREDVLTQNLFYLDTSDVEGTLTLEKEIRRLREEIDTYKGSLRKVLNDIDMANVVINISFQSRSLNNQEYSPFDWINNIDFYSVMTRSMEPISRGFGGAQTVLPTGFALIDKHPELKAISPEGGRFLLDQYKNYPEQTLGFWQESLSNHLTKKGYITIGEVGEYTPVGEAAFTVTKWGVPYGNMDYIFMTGIRLNRKNIEVLQVAIEARFFNEYF